jgi:hypothetical protein
MAYGQLLIIGNGHSYGVSCCLIWVQGTCGHFCAVDGYWRLLWANGRDHGQGNVPVSMAVRDWNQTDVRSM